MLKIGYVRLRDARSAEDTATLKAVGCHVVRAEEPSGPGIDGPTALDSVLDFIGEGDQLVVTRLEHLVHSTQSALETIDRLERKGATLFVVEPEISSIGESGRALRAALQAVAAMDPGSSLRRRSGGASADDILQLQRAGVGPVEIARRLGVSRMTIWRKLRALEA
jgi:DNA invertase Pin-like site-specific DNA recombinase